MTDSAYVSTHRGIHLSCPQPPTGDLRVWRYLDLERLIAMASAEKLWFTRVDLLGDEFEGSVTRGVYEFWKGNPGNAENMALFRSGLKRDCYVSCWHANESESEAMWRLYCPNSRGVAIQTTYAKLDASLPPIALLGMVSYVDYETPTPVGDKMLNMITPLMHKRLAFQYEHEVRAIIWRAAQLVADGVEPKDFPTDKPPVIGVPFDLATVVERVYVSPYADEWYRDVVAQVLLKFAPTMVDRLTWSHMKGVPLY
jgi:hypothetical protein